MSKPKTATPKLTSPKLGNDKPLILVCDDVSWFRSELCHQLLKLCGIRSLQAEHGLAAIRALERNPKLKAIICDWRFPQGPDGVAVLETVKKRWPHVKRMLISAYVEPSTYELGYERGFSVRDKALPIAKLAESIGEWLE